MVNKSINKDTKKKKPLVKIKKGPELMP